MKEAFTIALTCLLLAGCGGPVFDASSQESREQSVQRMMDALPEEDHGRLTSAINLVGMEGVTLDELEQGTDWLDGAFDRLDGKTAAQLMKEGDVIIAGKVARLREQALQEIVELERKRTDAGQGLSEQEARRLDALKAEFNQG